MTTFQELIRMFEEEHIRLPKHKIVCPRCDGEGAHVNPAIDGNGIPADEFYNEWDDESREMYLSGGYDVTCEECGGKNVVEEIDQDRLDATPELAKAWYEWVESWQESREIEAMERRMGA